MLLLAELAVGAAGQALMAALTMRLYLSTPAGGASDGQKGVPSRGMEGVQAALGCTEPRGRRHEGSAGQPEGVPSSMLPRQQGRLEMTPLVAAPCHLPKAFRMKNGNWLERSTPAEVVNVKRLRLLGQAVTRLRTDTKSVCSGLLPPSQLQARGVMCGSLAPRPQLWGGPVRAVRTPGGPK